MIIDFHTHITAPEIIERRDDYLVRENRGRGRGTTPGPSPHDSEALS